MLAYVEDSSRFTHYKITNFVEKIYIYTNSFNLFIISIYKINFTSVDILLTAVKPSTQDFPSFP